MVLTALAAIAGAALVQAMVTDGWEGVRRKVARVFGRSAVDPAIERRLDATREQLVAASPDELERVQAALTVQWQTRFEDLLADHPDAEADLTALVEDIRAILPVASVSASGQSLAAGGDIKIQAQGGSIAAGGNVTLPGPTAPGPASP